MGLSTAFFKLIRNIKNGNKVLDNQNDTVKEIIEYIKKILKDKLSNISFDEFEENGKVYYMNDQNGTYFDWNENKHLSPFMVFYKDGSCGALKMDIYSDGCAKTWLYKYGESSPFYEEEIHFNKEEIYNLAVILYKIADNNSKFGQAINDMNTNITIDKNDISSFNNGLMPFKKK